MTTSPGPNPPDQGGDDPWAAFGYLVAGVLFYGFIGWVVSRWLHADFWIPVGILVGAGFGMYMIFARYTHASRNTPLPNISSDDDEAARSKRPDINDRGETA